MKPGRTLPATRPSRVWFVALMLCLTALFAALGVWQWQRLGEKEALIATVAERMDDPPVPLPPAGEWATLDPDGYDFRPVTVAGRFVPDRTVLVFTNLARARGETGGPGYWVMTPFSVEGGEVLFVNRGFIPQEVADDRPALEPMNPRGGDLQLTGIARRAERPSAFTPEPDTENRIDWLRNPSRLAALAGVGGVVAPIYLDLSAGARGELPQGGETVVEFPNNHLGYAITWFGFAILTPVLLVFWLRRPRRAT